jgi:hypothetical protein
MKISWLNPAGHSISGHSHITNNLPCQDHHSILKNDSGWVIATVCDGAGSARLGGEGAKVFANMFCESLRNLANRIDASSPGQWINDYIVESLLKIRTHIRNTENISSLEDWNTTLLAVLMGPSGGLCVHVGDGAIFGGLINKYDDNYSTIDHKYFISRPENGEYSNETFFVTEGIWTKHLRISPLPSLDWIALATDGGCSLCLDNQLLPNNHFIPSILKTLINRKDDLSKILIEEMRKEQYKSATSDDKTVAIIINSKIFDSNYAEFITSKKLDMKPSVYGGNPSDLNASISLLTESEPAHPELHRHNILNNQNRIIIPGLISFIIGFMAGMYSMHFMKLNTENFRESQISDNNLHIENDSNTYYKFDLNKFRPEHWQYIKGDFLKSK